ncbi:hypothetical protein [Streptomyces shenzhenensis]|uniref:hypothetical protein n=1 Tax=Streptomyces shenzhenensis TaxID=943815 RepID=UPI0033C05B6D
MLPCIPHPTDGRSRLVVATDKGRALVVRAAQIWAEEEEKWAELVGADRLGDMRDALRMFVDTHDNGRVPLRPIW